MLSNRERQNSLPDASILGAWRKSTYSAGDGADCLEVNDAHREGGVPVRDSKNPHGPAVLFGAPAWHAFLAYLSR
ncbi:DUF397 domain-containing protein [Streptomyces sp. NPDC017940]|uniref:DUF397 domain-containing protein n=1 Tax=Streptomyces sp. NPDC017940 TaxID=3365017 RepID=UPI0037A6FE56